MILEFPGGLVVKDLVLLLLWLRFSPRPGNFCMLQVQPKKKKKKNKEKKRNMISFLSPGSFGPGAFFYALTGMSSNLAICCYEDLTWFAHPDP